MLDFSAQCHRQSDGLFDITTGVLRTVWDFKSGRLPASPGVAHTFERVGWRRLQWDGRRLFLPAGMELDLGGLVKEFAADRVLTLMNERDMVGLVNLADDIRVTGPRPDDTPWLIGIRVNRTRLSRHWHWLMAPWRPAAIMNAI